MGSKYPVLSPDEVIRTLKKFGFEYKSQKRSHIKYIKGDKTIIIPNHSEIAKGILKSILSMANIELEDFLKML